MDYPTNTKYINDGMDRIEPPQNLQFSQYKSPRQKGGYRSPYVSSERDLSLILNKSNRTAFESPEDLSVRKFIGVSVGLVSLITENLLNHPFLVLRRQCQVNHSSNKYHLQPFTLVPTIVRLYQRQGITTLWKGLGSSFLVRGLSVAIEDIITKLTPWPKEVNSRTTFKQFGQHILMKCISTAIVMPFYAASLVETVQSEIASEKPGLFDVFREGTIRLLSWSAPQKGRMLPIWALVGPSVSFGITKHIFGLILKGIFSRILRFKWGNKTDWDQQCNNPVLQSQDVDIYSTLISITTTEIVFYPCETILHRLQLQGTRTIIDNLDNGYAVVPIITSYEGVIDCYRTTFASEGALGLYKGFGAMLLQIFAHVAIIKLTKLIVTKMVDDTTPKFMHQKADISGLEEIDYSDSTTVSRSLSSMSGIE